MIVVDRVDGDRAILEVDGEIVEIPASALPDGAKEGTWLSLVANDNDRTEEHAKKIEAEARLERLRRRDDGAESIDL